MTQVLSPLLLCSLGITGLVLLIRGWRGLLVDHHPYCRHCGFDLVGLYPSSGGDGTRLTNVCPECGERLEARTAIIVGRRLRRPALAWSGSAMVVLAATGGALLVWSWVTRFNWNSVKPEPLLAWEIEVEPPSSVLQELAEITKRIRAGTLSTSVRGRAVARALAIQADPHSAWLPAWGDLVEEARRKGGVSDDQWRRYATQAVSLALLGPGSIRQGEAAPLEVVFSTPRAGNSRSELCARIEVTGLLAPDRLVTAMEGSQAFFLDIGQTPTMPCPVIVDADPGDYPIAVRCRVRIEESVGGPTLVGFTLEPSLRLVVTSHDPVDLVTDPALANAVRGALSLADGTVAAYRTTRPRQLAAQDGPRTLEVVINVTEAPIALAFEVVLRERTAQPASTGAGQPPVGSASREWALGIFTIPEGQSRTVRARAILPDLDARYVDVVLRPTQRAAFRLGDVRRVWGGTIVVPDIPVRDAEPIPVTDSPPPAW